MTPFQWVLLAGAIGTFGIIYQNWLSFQDTRVELEDRLRERLKGRGNADRKVAVTIDEIRIVPLSARQRLKWYLGMGVDSEVEVKLETNAVIGDGMWDAVEEMLDEVDVDDIPDVEHLQTEKSPQNQTGLSIVQIDSVDESEVMMAVCAIPVAIDNLDPDISFEPDGASPLGMPDEYEDLLERMQ